MILKYIIQDDIFENHCRHMFSWRGHSLNWKVGLMRGVEHVTNPEPRRKGVLRDSLFPPTHLGHMGR